VTNQVVDIGLLTQTAEPARAILEVATIDVVADRGYFKIEDCMSPLDRCLKTLRPLIAYGDIRDMGLAEAAIDKLVAAPEGQDLKSALIILRKAIQSNWRAPPRSREFAKLMLEYVDTKMPALRTDQ
jgi:hypothetical protein